MKVFISWSGNRSKAIAIALKEWLPLVLQYAKPWVSDKDISAGDRWAQAIAGELESANFGILCITPENVNSEWILFEAGALSKSMLDAKVIPLLFGLELRDLSGPLSQFQALKMDQPGILSVLKAINAVSEHKAADATIEQLVPVLWAQLQQKLDAIPEMEKTGKAVRPQSEILEELVTQVRGLNSRMRDFDPEMMDREARFLNSKYRDYEPRMLNELMHSMMDSRDGDMSLVMLAGMVRDRMPWLAEVLIEAHRELKTADADEAREIGHRVMRLVKGTLRGPMGEGVFGRTKSGHVLLMELPQMIDRAVSNRIESRQFLDENREGKRDDSDLL